MQKGEFIMKKDVSFSISLLIVGVLLFLLRATGMTAHIVISIIGIAILAEYTAVTVKEWKNPAMEIGVRAPYGIALISGIVIKIKYVEALSVIHKIFAVLFVILLVAVLTYKIAKNKKA